MPLPDFTDDERYLVDFAKSVTASSQANTHLWGYLTMAVVVVCFGWYYDNLLVVVSAFFMVCGFRVYEENCQAKWLPLWRSIIGKYESAIIDEPTEKT